MITLATLPEASEQDVFDQVAAHLLRQNAKSLMSEGTTFCRYRGIDNRQCAAGCLIGDDEYDPALEGSGWDSLASESVVPREHEALISDLQDVHDSWTVADWPEQLRQLAQHYQLDEDTIDLWEAKNL